MKAEENSELKCIKSPLGPTGRCFKLRFAGQQEPGRSRVSAIKPLTLPTRVTSKCGQRESMEVSKDDEERALCHVKSMFQQGPREKYQAPILSSHEYGWWSTDSGLHGNKSRWLNHHICDSPWLKASIRVLTSDASFRR